MTATPADPAQPQLGRPEAQARATEGLGAAELAAVEREHNREGPYLDGTYDCGSDAQVWPCDAARLLAWGRAAERERDELRLVVECRKSGERKFKAERDAAFASAAGLLQYADHDWTCAVADRDVPCGQDGWPKDDPRCDCGLREIVTAAEPPRAAPGRRSDGWTREAVGRCQGADTPPGQGAARPREAD